MRWPKLKPPSRSEKHAMETRYGSPNGSALLTSATGRRKWAALAVLCLGQLMIVLDVTVVNVALPTIQKQLHFTQANLAWVVNAYLLTFGGLMLLAGRLGDIVGRKKVFVAGTGAFTVASLLCGLANSEALLIGARFVQGAAAAFMASMILGILVTMFPKPRERATAMGVYAFVASSGGSIGLLLGGVLTETLNWHWIFFINLPIGAAALLLGLALLDESPGLGFRQGVDLIGALLAVAAPTTAVYTIVKASEWGWESVRTLVALALLLFGRMPVHGNYVVDVLPGMLVFGVGAGLAFTPGVSLAMADAGPSEAGTASGLANVTLQLGAALGLAVLASVSTTH